MIGQAFEELASSWCRFAVAVCDDEPAAAALRTALDRAGVARDLVLVIGTDDTAEPLEARCQPSDLQRAIAAELRSMARNRLGGEWATDRLGRRDSREAGQASGEPPAHVASHAKLIVIIARDAAEQSRNARLLLQLSPHSIETHEVLLPAATFANRY